MWPWQRIETYLPNYIIKDILWVRQIFHVEEPVPRSACARHKHSIVISKTSASFQMPIGQSEGIYHSWKQTVLWDTANSFVLTRCCWLRMWRNAQQKWGLSTEICPTYGYSRAITGSMDIMGTRLLDWLSAEEVRQHKEKPSNAAEDSGFNCITPVAVCFSEWDYYQRVIWSDIQ